MYKIQLDWINLKLDIITKGFTVNYRTIIHGYEVFVVDRNLLWTATVVSASDIADFEENYKADCNKCLYDEDGREYQRADIRPIGCQTVFTGRGDSETNIGDGKEFSWNFANDEDIIDNAPSGFKRKRIEFKFIDSVWIKDGTFYYFDVLKDSRVDVWLVCMPGGRYLDNDGNVQIAEEDIPVIRFIVNHPIQGSVAMGDELNSESVSPEIPSFYKFWMDVTVPLNDNVSNGHCSLEMYRKRSIIL